MKKKELQRRNRYNIWIKENDTENNEKIKTLVNQEDYSSALVVFLEYLASLKSSISVCLSEDLKIDRNNHYWPFFFHLLDNGHWPTATPFHHKYLLNT